MTFHTLYGTIMSLDGNMHIKKGELNMCTNNENQIKAVLGKRIYEILKLEYLESYLHFSLSSLEAEKINKKTK